MSLSQWHTRVVPKVLAHGRVRQVDGQTTLAIQQDLLSTHLFKKRHVLSEYI